MILFQDILFARVFLTPMVNCEITFHLEITMLVLGLVD